MMVLGNDGIAAALVVAVLAHKSKWSSEWLVPVGL